jgi:hypothetical protein
MAGDALRSLQDDPQTNRKPLAGAVALSPCDVRPPDHVQSSDLPRKSFLASENCSFERPQRDAGAV